MVLVKQVAVADQDLLASYLSNDPAALEDLGSFNFFSFQVFIVASDGFRQRVGRFFFHADQKLFSQLALAVLFHLADPGVAVSQGPGLVEHDRVDLAELGDDFTTFKKDPLLGPIADSGHVGDRNPDNQGTRAAENQDGYSQFQVLADEANNNGQEQDDWGVVLGEAVN